MFLLLLVRFIIEYHKYLLHVLIMVLNQILFLGLFSVKTRSTVVHGRFPPFCAFTPRNATLETVVDMGHVSWGCVTVLDSGLASDVIDSSVQRIAARTEFARKVSYSYFIA